MNITELQTILPSHWEMWDVNDASGWNDDGRDYTKPGFIRKDGLARIYFNDSPGEDCVYSIAFDYHNDGECFPDLKEAVNYCDNYIATYPLEYHTCKVCQNKAIWYYTPASDMFLVDKFYCAEHVPRGCSCNIEIDGTEILDNFNGVLKPLPCCEYTFNEYGFPKEQ